MTDAERQRRRGKRNALTCRVSCSCIFDDRVVPPHRYVRLRKILGNELVDKLGRFYPERARKTCGALSDLVLLSGALIKTMPRIITSELFGSLDHNMKLCTRHSDRLRYVRARTETSAIISLHDLFHYPYTKCSDIVHFHKVAVAKIPS